MYTVFSLAYVADVRVDHTCTLYSSRLITSDVESVVRRRSEMFFEPTTRTAIGP